MASCRWSWVLLQVLFRSVSLLDILLLDGESGSISSGALSWGTGW